ncbi:MAG: hypothetical protein HQ557_00885 [Bacteroidetes bacterium]|nr:hypothetical protein [Bacteroidota bacterium]
MIKQKQRNLPFTQRQLFTDPRVPYPKDTPGNIKEEAIEAVLLTTKRFIEKLVAES